MPGTRQTRSQAKFDDTWNLNHRSLVSRLPPEVLLLIFDFVRLEQEKNRAAKLSEDYTSLNSTDESTGKIGWIIVGQVCRRWRETALASPKLWSNIKVEDKKCRWAMEMLKRSKKTLLSIHLDLYIMDKRCKYKQTRTALARSALLHVQKHLGRCKSLSILSGDCGYIKLDSVLEGYPMPNLETLVINGEKSIQPDIELSDKELAASSLRILKLSHVALDFDSKFLRGLTTLQIHHCTTSIPFLRLLDCLALIPLLKQLNIHLSSFTLDRPDLPLVRAHSLNSHSLDLIDLTILATSPFETTALLSVTNNFVHLEITLLGITQGASLASDLESFWTTVSDRLTEAGRSFCHYDFGVTQDIFIVKGHGTQENSVTFELNLGLHKGDILPSALLQSVHIYFPMDGLSSIEVYSRAPLDLAPNLGTVRTLTTVCVEGSFVPDFFENLCDEDAFPALEHISVTVSKSFFHQFKSGPLLRGLRARHERDTPIKVLSLKGVFAMSAAIKKTLQSVVGSLKVEYEE
ncbi:hypothetical protein CPB83DRAFT_846069 [Crepidotus variabilis]|uniref:F-box domain-containing protein n=1 Tax=Crepidotus variabilis TaxID=179855 RepID=A0A9P6ENW3_9AGAR|nr:hypothetical protein CPB83DRAFT_846069 [Crepidotus variabilis]